MSEYDSAGSPLLSIIVSLYCRLRTLGPRDHCGGPAIECRCGEYPLLSMLSAQPLSVFSNTTCHGRARASGASSRSRPPGAHWRAAPGWRKRRRRAPDSAGTRRRPPTTVESHPSRFSPLAALLFIYVIDSDGSRRPTNSEGHGNRMVHGMVLGSAEHGTKVRYRTRVASTSR